MPSSRELLNGRPKYLLHRETSPRDRAESLEELLYVGYISWHRYWMGKLRARWSSGASLQSSDGRSKTLVTVSFQFLNINTRRTGLYFSTINCITNSAICHYIYISIYVCLCTQYAYMYIITNRILQKSKFASPFHTMNRSG